MRHGLKVGVALAALVAVGVLAASALGVVNGSPDNGRHPYVGMAVWFPTGDPSGGFELCSGSLVSATVFVTAAHCFPDGAQVIVDMKEDAFADLHQPGFGSALPGTAHVDPNWDVATDTNDLAVVTIDGGGFPQPNNRYAKLPSVGYDDTLPNNQQVEIVGYGIQTQTPLTFGSRFDAPAKVIPGAGKAKKDFIKVSSSQGQGGATCNGDSGGPDLQAGTDLILAISAYGKNADCKSPAYSQRLDTAEAASFIGGFLH
jgi:hypothetical protein